MSNEDGLPPEVRTAKRAQMPFGGRANVIYKPEVTLIWDDRDGRHEVKITAPTTAGSSLYGGICVADPTVSRVHCEVRPTTEGVWIRDLGSQNGSFCQSVLGDPIRFIEVLLLDRMQFVIGGTKITIQHGRESKPTELPAATTFGELIGHSAVMRALFGDLWNMAHSAAPILINGETGTGKELAARAIHDHSDRATGPYIVVDCGSLPRTLLEAALFGHAKGAFTGADRDHLGAFLAAHGGTLFLDEIGEVPLDMQPRFLRMMESGTVCRLGETQQRAADVRFVSATHRDLAAMVNLGSFREDLFFRLNVLNVVMPPLRARPEDLPYLLAHLSPRRMRGQDVDPAVTAALQRRLWPGNVRELRNLLMRVDAVGWERALQQLEERPPMTGAAPTSDDPATAIDFTGPFAAARAVVMAKLESDYLRAAMQRHNGDAKKIAAEMGFQVSYIYKLIRRMT